MCLGQSVGWLRCLESTSCCSRSEKQPSVGGSVAPWGKGAWIIFLSHYQDQILLLLTSILGNHQLLNNFHHSFWITLWNQLHLFPRTCLMSWTKTGDPGPTLRALYQEQDNPGCLLSLLTSCLPSSKSSGAGLRALSLRLTCLCKLRFTGQPCESYQTRWQFCAFKCLQTWKCRVNGSHLMGECEGGVGGFPPRRKTRVSYSASSFLSFWLSFLLVFTSPC